MTGSPEGLVVLNPPIVKLNEETTRDWDVICDQTTNLNGE